MCDEGDFERSPEEQYEYELRAENEWFDFLMRGREHFIDNWGMHHHALAAGLMRASLETTEEHNFELDIEAGFITEDEDDEDDWENDKESWQ